MKSHHRIFGHEETRIFGFERKLDFLPEQKPGIRHAIAHFDEIFEGQIRDRIRVGLARVFEFREQFRPVGAVAIQQFQERGAIFERAIHSLPEKRNDGVGRVSEQQRLSVHVPGEHLIVTIEPVGLLE